MCGSKLLRCYKKKTCTSENKVVKSSRHNSHCVTRKAHQVIKSFQWNISTMNPQNHQMYFLYLLSSIALVTLSQSNIFCYKRSLIQLNHPINPISTNFSSPWRKQSMIFMGIINLISALFVHKIFLVYFFFLFN